MVYLYDFFFVMVYLLIKHLFIKMHDKQFKIFMSIRQPALWVEFSWILVGIYFAPHHTASERAVSFGMCILTKLVFGTYRMTVNNDLKQ